jgi:hypothetical protein
MVSMEIFNEGKAKHLSQKEYVAKTVSNVAKKLTSVAERIEKASDEVLIAELANCKSILENILDNLTHENKR